MGMIKANVLRVNYTSGDSREKQGKWDDIQPYLNQGYYVDENKSRNGFWLLIRPAHAWVTLSNGIATSTFDMKDDIKFYYGKSRISQNLCNQFVTDVQNGIVVCELDQTGQYYQLK